MEVTRIIGTLQNSTARTSLQNSAKASTDVDRAKNVWMQAGPEQRRQAGAAIAQSAQRASSQQLGQFQAQIAETKQVSNNVAQVVSQGNKDVAKVLYSVLTHPYDGQMRKTDVGSFIDKYG